MVTAPEVTTTLKAAPTTANMAGNVMMGRRYLWVVVVVVVEAWLW
jgi:hypothetical protein